MKLNELILEEKTDQERLDDYISSLAPFKELIHRDCGPFLNKMKNVPLYRAMDKVDTFIDAKVRKDRKPLSSSAESHKYLDMWLKRKIGIKARSESLFASPHENISADYGSRLYFIFPKHEYKLIWFTMHKKPVADTLVLSNKLKRIKDTLTQNDPNVSIEDKIEKFFNDEKVKVHVTDTIERNQFVEIGINCDEYYALKIPTGVLGLAKVGIYNALVEE